MNLVAKARQKFQLRSRLRRMLDARLTDQFHKLSYRSSGAWRQNLWMGYRIKQLPHDMWLYQEIIFREKPDFILQTGIRFGGSLLFFAHMLDLMQAAPGVIVIGIDIRLTNEAKSLEHPRIRLIEGSSTDARTVEQVRALAPSPYGFISLDSDHRRAHVLDELRLYHAFVKPGTHLVVEDTNINGHPVLPRFGPGPYEAVSDFLREQPEFVRDDRVWQRNLFSHHQYGWLKRTE